VTRVLALLLLLLAGCGASAQTVCKITAGSFPFGTYDTLVATPTTTLFNILVRCDRNGGPGTVAVNLAVGPGSHGSTPDARRMQHTTVPGNYLNYGLFTDGSYLTPVGTSPGANTLAQTLTIPNKSSATATFTLYGRIPQAQNVRAGSYSDSVQVTVAP